MQNLQGNVHTNTTEHNYKELQNDDREAKNNNDH